MGNQNDHQFNGELITRNISKSSAGELLESTKVFKPTPPPIHPPTSGLMARLAPMPSTYQPNNGKNVGMRAYVKLPPISTPHRVGITAQMPQVAEKKEDIPDPFSCQRILNPVVPPRKKLLERRGKEEF